MAQRGTPEAPIVRSAGRVLLVDEADRLLLLRVEDPLAGEPVLWLAPGGGMEADEDSAAAAVRELFEETGLRAPAAGHHVWRRRHAFSYGGAWMEAREDYYLLRIATHAPTSEGFSDFERRVVRAHRWRRLPELVAAKSEVFVPRELARLVAPLLAGALPSTPLEVGA